MRFLLLKQLFLETVTQESEAVRKTELPELSTSMTELNFRCRFYVQKCPDIDDIVIARVCSLSDMGAYVSLLEYNGIEGMLQISELSRRRIRALTKLTKVGRVECLSVLRVQEEKGYIDLSKRRVSPEDIHLCRERYTRAKSVNSVLHRAAEILEFQTDEQFQDLYEKTAWYFDKKYNKKTASFDVFQKAAVDSSALDECDIDPHTKCVLVDCVKQKLLTLPKKIRASFEICNFEYEGIDAIKEALYCGMDCSTESVSITANLISHPEFIISAVANENEGMHVMYKALEAIKTSITSQGGYFKHLKGPEIVNEKTESKIAELSDNPE